MDTKKVSTCRGSFGGFEATCFQLDRAASLDSTGFSYFSCDTSLFFPDFFVILLAGSVSVCASTHVRMCSPLI